MKIIDVYKQKLRFRNYSERTIETYSCYLDKFIIVQKTKDPYQISLKQITFYLENREYSSISVQNQIIGSLKLFAKYILNKKDVHLGKIERPKRIKKLPLVIETEKLKSSILGIDNLKHKSIIMLGYSCALRVSEVINLKIKDIDSDRMLINIRNAKGRKDRIVAMSETLLKTFRNYVREYRPIEYLFNGQFSLQYSASSCNNIVKKYLGDDYHFHTLRHSGATTMHENGTDLALIKKLLGHNNIKTTMIYTHISQKAIQNVALPM